MTGKSRRHFLKLATASLGTGAILGAMPVAIRKALAIPAASRHGTIEDVEHVIVLMQENRSFDHYFGSLRGVRGYSDPHPIHLPDGKPVWYQPSGKGKAVTPFHLNTKTAGGMVVPSLDHSWKESHDLWKHHDAWITRKTAMTMGYFVREDLPFYYALADAFTICDAYHCSIFGPTNPNRLFLMTGTSGLSAGSSEMQVVRNPEGDTNDGADPDKDTAGFKGFNWTSYAERLEHAGIDWRVYQEYDNFGDNALAYFAQFRGLPTGSSLRKRARSVAPGSTPANAQSSRGEYLIAEMENDIKAGKLPQVSWLVPSSTLSEHPACSSPLYGEIFVSKLLEMLTRYPDVWAKTVLFINYDENDGIFDHMPPQVPALDDGMGKSTIAPEGESYHGVPVGLGPRVPMIVVSPWSKGGFVTSEVFDHTSVIRFMEKRFGVMEPNISPWRRSVCGDLTSAFDFSAPNTAWEVMMPDTAALNHQVETAKRLPLPTPPHTPTPLPKQEAGQRLTRPLTYDLTCEGVCLDTSHFSLRLKNTGTRTACLIVYADGSKAGPWFYTLEAGKMLQDVLPVQHNQYAFTVHGPNGFIRHYHGPAEAPQITISTAFDKTSGQLVVRLQNYGAGTKDLTIRDYYSANAPRHRKLNAGQSVNDQWVIETNDHWYDLEIISEATVWRFAGHCETGRVSRSDPALGR